MELKPEPEDATESGGRFLTPHEQHIAMGRCPVVVNNVWCNRRFNHWSGKHEALFLLPDGRRTTVVILND